MSVRASNELLAGYSTNALREAARLIRFAHLLLAEPSEWTRERWSVDANGREVPFDSLNGVRWCAGGAILRAHRALSGYAVPIEIPIDPRTNEADRVAQPKRAVVALELLGQVLLEQNRKRIASSGRKGRATLRKLRKQHPTLLASDINDLRQIAHPHVLLGLVAALVAIHDELAARRCDRGTSSERAE